jgi:hypothetical protein
MPSAPPHAAWRSEAESKGPWSEDRSWCRGPSSVERFPNGKVFSSPPRAHGAEDSTAFPLVRGHMVGATGFEPVTSSVSETTGNRCAEARFPRSRPTVGAEVKCSLGVQLRVLLHPGGRSAIAMFGPPARFCAGSCSLSSSTRTIDHSAVLDPVHNHDLAVVVDLVDHPVVPASC